MPRDVAWSRQNGRVTEEGQPSVLERWHRELARSEGARRDQNIKPVRDRQEIDDADLIAAADGMPPPYHAMEMQRRLKVTVNELTAELVSFREAAGAAAAKSDKQAARLVSLTRWLIGLTVGLLLLTVAVVVLTAVLTARPG
jgi:hypothetical protein